MASNKSPTEKILERLPALSASGYTNKDILKLIKIIDSYHDFNGSQSRIKEAYDEDEEVHARVLETASTIEADISKLVKQTSSQAKPNPFFMLLNNYFNSLFPEIDYEQFFKISGVKRYDPERSGEAFFEKECGSALYATSAGCFHTTTFDPESLMSTYAINLKKDDKHINDPSLANKLLKWFFPEKQGSGGIGLSFDAAESSLVKYIMVQLNDKTKGFYTTQIVTPQNIADSALTDYYALEEHLDNILFTDMTGRTEYVPMNSSEYSNLFSETYGKFSIRSRAKDFRLFDWEFTPNGEPSIAFDISEIRSEAGPSVTFLAKLLYCWLMKENDPKMDLFHSWENIANTKINSTIISPLPIIEKLYDKHKNIIPRLLFDIKRLGDHEQANAVYYYNNNKENIYTTIFVTIDRLSALYSRLLGNPTILVTGSNLWCYRGSEILKDPLKNARFEVENTVSQINYYLFNITSLISMKETSDIIMLLDNLETYKDKNPFVGKYSDLKNSLLRAKVYNSIEFLKDIIQTGDISSMLLEKTRLINLLVKVTDVNYEKEGINIILTPSLTLSQLQEINKVLSESKRVLESKMSLVSVYLQHYNKFKYQTAQGDYTIFSHHHQLYFSESKLNDSLDAINYNKEDIDKIVVSVIALSLGAKQDGKTLLQKRCYEFIDGFFNSPTFDKTSAIFLLDLVIEKLTETNVFNTIKAFFTIITNTYASEDPNRNPILHKVEQNMLLVKNASNANKEYELARALVISSSHTKQREIQRAKEKATKLDAQAKLASSALLQILEQYVTVNDVKQPTKPRKQTSSNKTNTYSKLTELRTKANVKKVQFTREKRALVPHFKITRKRGGTTMANSVYKLMEPLLIEISKTIFKIHDYLPNSLILIPGNFIKHIQTYPHPLPYKVVARKINSINSPISINSINSTVAINSTLAINSIKQHEIKVGSGKTRKQKPHTKHTRKGGQYVQTPSNAFLNYDTLKQQNYFNEAITSIRNIAKTKLPNSQSKIEKQWFSFKVLLDSKDTPYLADHFDVKKIPYDLRMLKLFVDLSNNILISITQPISIPQFLTAEQITTHLDANETVRIGTNNIIYYEELKAKNITELEEYGENIVYDKNRLLCKYIISEMEKQIEYTKLLIRLVGSEDTSEII